MQDKKKEEEEIESVRRKIGQLKAVAINIGSEIRKQNEYINKSESLLGNSAKRISENIKHVLRVNSYRFRGWIFYLISSFLFMFLIFLLFIIF